MSSEPQKISVAIADINNHQRQTYENLLHDESGITLLRDVVSGSGFGGDHGSVNRRLKPRTNTSVSENEVARIKRLNPLVLLVHMNDFSDEDQELLISLRRECADALIVLLADGSVHENRLLQSLEFGTRGYLINGTAQSHLSKAVKIVGRGDIWVPRKMVANAMSRMLN